MVLSCKNIASYATSENFVHETVGLTGCGAAFVMPMTGYGVAMRCASSIGVEVFAGLEVSGRVVSRDMEGIF